MTDERILLDNLHGRINALTALCTVMVSTRQDAEVILTLFQKELQGMQKADLTATSDNYFLGMKAIHDHLVNAVTQVQLDLSLLAQETTHEH